MLSTIYSYLRNRFVISEYRSKDISRHRGSYARWGTIRSSILVSGEIVVCQISHSFPISGYEEQIRGCEREGDGKIKERRKDNGRTEWGENGKGGGKGKEEELYLSTAFVLLVLAIQPCQTYAPSSPTLELSNFWMIPLKIKQDC